jgi:hypothetical protein
MLNYITPEKLVKAVGLVKHGKVYALGEELHNGEPESLAGPAAASARTHHESDGACCCGRTA